jgi:hypothetical protein
VSVERPPLPGIDPPAQVEEMIDCTPPFSVWSLLYGPGGSSYKVQARRPDGSILTVMHGLDRGEASRIVSLLRYAIQHGEEWAIKPIGSA